MIDPYGLRICQYCGEPSFDTRAKERCRGPSIEEMHANLERNLELYTFIQEIKRN